MDLLLWRWRFLEVFLAAVFALHHFCHADTAPFYSFVQESTSAPPESYYDYIIIGGGTAGCPLAATLSQSATVLVLERGGSPYVNPSKTDKEYFASLLDPTNPNVEPFMSEDGVYNHRARVLGGGSVINAGFYSHGEAAFVKGNKMDEALVNDAYKWVENKLVSEQPVLDWQSAVRDGLLEAGVLPYNGFTFDHINGTKIGATTFDLDGHRHSAANLLEYANPNNIRIYLHATVCKVTFTIEKGGSRPRAERVIFEDAMGGSHTALLKKGSNGEIIISAGAIGSPQLLMLSGIGPAQHLQALGIEVVLDQPMVGRNMADNPTNGLFVPSPLPVEVSIIAHVGITQSGNYIESASGLNLAPSWTKLLTSSASGSLLNTRIPGSLLNTRTPGGIIFEKIDEPISRGHLELRSTNPHDIPKVRFNYFQAPEDVQKCVQGMETVMSVINSKAFSKFRFPLVRAEALMASMAALPVNMRPRHLNTGLSLEQFCVDTVFTLYHYHGGCQVGKVVDQDYRVLGVDGLRVIDGSTFDFSPGTNPQATLMMLGRYMGIRIQEERHSRRRK